MENEKIIKNKNKCFPHCQLINTEYTFKKTNIRSRTGDFQLYKVDVACCLWSICQIIVTERDGGFTSYIKVYTEVTLH
jgi:hypothetical protein